MSKKRKSIYNMAFGIFNQVITLLVGLIIPRFFILQYGSEINGLQSSVAYIYTYISLLEAGIGTATLQALFGSIGREDRTETNEILSATNIQYKRIAIIYAISVIMFSIIYPNTIQTSINKTLISSMIILSGVSSLMSFCFYGKFVILLQADGRAYIISIIGLLSYLLMNLVKIVAIAKGFSIISIYLGSSIISVLLVFFYYFYRKKYYPWISYKGIPKMESISQSKNVLVHQISSIVSNSTDILLLTYVAGDLRLVSVYNLYAMIFDALKSMISNIFSSVQFVMGQTYNKDISLYRRYHQIYEVLDFLVSFSLYSTAYVLILPFMKIYTKGISDIAYIDVYLPILFVLIKLLTSIREPASLLINYAGHFQKTQIRAIIETTMNLILSLVGVYLMGIYGVLLGTIIALLYRTIDMYIYTSKRFLNRSLWISIKQWLIYMSGFTIICVIFSRININPNNFIEFFIIAIPVFISISLFYMLYTLIFNYKIICPVIKKLLSNLNKK